jgi:hypothetical protein
MKLKNSHLYISSMILSGILFLQSCSASNTLPTSQPTTTPEIQQIITNIPKEHLIGVRVLDGTGEFYNRLTGEKFVPRGNNYISLDPMTKNGGEQVITFSMFNPGFYDHAAASQALRQMHSAGYNVVRIFIESEGTDGLGGINGLNPEYMDNLADFLKLAKENEIYAIFAKQWLPLSPRYGDIIATQCCDTFGFANAIHLAPAGVEAHKLFFQDLIKALIERNAPLDAIFSYNISNEFYFDADQPPLSWKSGKVTLGSGKVYDMAKAEDKEAMMDDALITMIDEVRKAILEIDATALVSIGFFAPQEPNPHRIGDTRLSRTHAAIWESTADYIDLHAYPGGDLTFAQHLENYGMDNMQTKPIILGEYGAFKSLFVSTEAAAQSLVDWQVESCKYGIDGWLLWTWDDTTNGEIIPATAENGLISDLLSPAIRQDPCAYGSGFVRNLSLNASARASRFLPTEPPEFALDGLGNTQWGAGYDAIQWIEIDLGKQARISEIRLMVAQFPEGETTHIIKARSADGNFVEVARFDQFTRSEDWLSFMPAAPLEDVQVVRVETTRSPSWVAWKEIQVYGE